MNCEPNSSTGASTAGSQLCEVTRTFLRNDAPESRDWARKTSINLCAGSVRVSKKEMLITPSGATAICGWNCCAPLRVGSSFTRNGADQLCPRLLDALNKMSASPFALSDQAM